MSQPTNFLAVDLGASSGRVMLGQWDGERWALHELHRFPNGAVSVRGHLYWDVLRLWQEIKTGMREYALHHEAPLAGIGIDTWAVDFALLDSQGNLLGNPHHYRDPRTTGMAEWVESIVPPDRLFARTGIQRLPFNTLFQLASLAHSDAPSLALADTLLLMPDLFHFWMTGRRVAEYTNATTTNFLDAQSRHWATELLDEVGLPTAILPDVVPPGVVLGELLPEVRDEVGLRHPVPVIAVGTHDTASAVAAIPSLDERSVYISSGTWNLVGVELDEPILTEAAQRLNFTNEGGVAGTIRLLKNVTGLWLLQECQRHWQREGHSYSWPELVAEAEAAPPLRSLVDPDAPDFLAPPDMPAALRAFCQRSGQPEPTSVGEIVRCCLDSLALKQRGVIESLETLTGRTFDTIRVVGGGSQNALLCQLTADAAGRQVVAGPVEATALGNLLVQAVATGHLPDLAAGRAAVAASVPQTMYEPRGGAEWDSAFSTMQSRSSS